MGAQICLGELAVGGNFAYCLIIVVIFMGGLEKHIDWGNILETSLGASHEGMEPFLWRRLTPRESWPLETPCKDFNLAIGGGLGWMDSLKNGAGKRFIFHAIIPALYPFWWKFYWLSQSAFIFSMLGSQSWKNKEAMKMWSCYKIVLFFKNFDHYHHELFS